MQLLELQQRNISAYKFEIKKFQVIHTGHQ